MPYDSRVAASPSARRRPGDRDSSRRPRAGAASPRCRRRATASSSPMPDNISSWGERIAPAATITSRRAASCLVPAAPSTLTPTARRPSMTILAARVLVRSVRLPRWLAGLQIGGRGGDATSFRGWSPAADRSPRVMGPLKSSVRLNPSPCHGLQKRRRHGIGPLDERDVHRAAVAVVRRVRIGVVVLRAQEVRQHLAVAPARIASRRPVIEVASDGRENRPCR